MVHGKAGNAHIRLMSKEQLRQFIKENNLKSAQDAQNALKDLFAVQVVENWVLAPLWHWLFFSLSEINQELKRYLEDLNNRPFQKLYQEGRPSHRLTLVLFSRIYYPIL